jgi:hypothetical protein
MMSFDENGDEVNSNQLRVLARVTYTPDSWRSLRSLPGADDVVESLADKSPYKRSADAIPSGFL